MNELIKVGAKVRRKGWASHAYYEILFVGKERFFYIDSQGIEFYAEINDKWELYEEPKKTVMMYPALILEENALNGSKYYWVSNILHKEESTAIKEYGSKFIKLLTDRGIEVEV